MEVKTKDLWVFVETNPDGSAKNVGIELLTPGRLMADKQGGDLVAVVLGKDVSAAVEEINAHGADQIIVAEGPEYEAYTTDAYATALVELIEKYAPTSVLIGATPNGRDLGPRISCRLKTGLTADCTELDIDEETGNVLWTRPAIGGNLMAQIQCPEHRPQMGTVRPGVFRKSDPVEGHATIIREDVHVAPDDIRTKVIEVIDQIGDETVDLEGAEIIVAGGRGVGALKGSRSSATWQTPSAPPSAAPAPLSMRAGSPTHTRSVRPVRPSGRGCTSPAASPVPSSTPPVLRAQRPSSPSTTTRTRPSSAWRTTASSATSSRSSPSSSSS